MKPYSWKTEHHNPQQAWNVFRPLSCERFRWLDTVFFDPDMDALDVYGALVNHDNYPSYIVVKKEH